MRLFHCPHCGVEKPEDDFYRKVDRRHSWCKRCFNDYCMKRWTDRKKKFIELLGGRCADCAGEFHPAVYDFHHLRDKDVQWTKLRLRSESAIRIELEKCVLLCANCHRLRHHATAT